MQAIVSEKHSQNSRLNIFSLIRIDCSVIIIVIGMYIMTQRKLPPGKDVEVTKLQLVSRGICSVYECTEAQMPEIGI